MARLNLREIREKRGLTQTKVAENMGKHQSGAAQMESRDNILIKTLRRYIEATGGKMRIYAEYEDDICFSVVEVDDEA